MLFLDFFKKKRLVWYLRSALKTAKKRPRHISQTPFPHVVIDNVFPERIHRALTREFRNVLDRGLSLAWNKNFFSRLAIYNASIWTPSPFLPSSSNIFFTEEWLNFVTGFFPAVQRTNNTGLTFHHHPIKSRDTLVWHGMAYGAFKNNPLPNGINAWYHNCKHAEDPTTGNSEDIFHEIRALAVVYFLNNGPWREGSGGEMGLYREGNTDAPAALIAPLNNRLLIFEVTPHSFHGFRKNFMHEQNCIVQWIFEKPEDTFRKYDKKNIVPWTEVRSAVLHQGYPVNPGPPPVPAPRQKQKTILLIGCGGKLGSAFVRRYGTEYRIIGVARSASSRQSLLYDFIQADASWEWERIIDTVLARHASIDVLINNAVSYDYTPLLEKKVHHFSTELQTNLIAPLAFAQGLLRKDWLRFTPEKNRLQNRLIINIGSISGTKLRKNIDQGTYSVTKAALHMLALHMATEWKIYGIRANVVAFHGFKQRVSPETATAAIDACIHNRDATGQIFLVSDTNVETYAG